ncbi:MAG: hypothetical protein IJ816_05025 [Alloprevotella sp.]|nr:hypothetical protein [Alloprevotella sp.]
MLKKLRFLTLTMVLTIGSCWVAKAGPSDLPQLSTPESPVYYVVMNAYSDIDEENPGQFRYLAYQGYNRNRVKLLRVGDMTDAFLWYFVGAGGAKDASEGCYFASLGALQETHAYVSNTFEGPYLSNARQYNYNICFFSQQTSDAVWYIHHNPYDKVGCYIANTAAQVEGSTRGYWYHDKVALIGEDNFFVKDVESGSALQNQDYQKYVFYSYQDLLDIAKANNVAIATYEAMDRTKGASFKALIEAINSAKASAAVPTVTDGLYLLRNRRHGLYLNTANGNTTLQAVTHPTQCSVWNLTTVGGTRFLTSLAGESEGKAIRVSVSSNVASFDLQATNSLNAQAFKSSDGDRRFISFDQTDASTGWFSMDTRDNDHVIYARSSQGWASDWEYIKLTDAEIASYGKAVTDDNAEIAAKCETQFFRLRNVARDFAHSGFDHVVGYEDFVEGGYLEDVDHEHNKTDFGAANTAEAYAAVADLSHASALWYFEQIGHGADADDGENATGVISPRHNIYLIRNANTGKYITQGLVADGAVTNAADGKGFINLTTDRSQAAKIFFQKLIDGQYAMMVYRGTSGATDQVWGSMAITGQGTGYEAGLTWQNEVVAKNTAWAWNILPAPTLRANYIELDTDDEYQFATIHYPFDARLSAENESGLEAKFYKGVWMSDESGLLPEGKLRQYEVADVPGSNAVLVRGNKGYDYIVLDVAPDAAGLATTPASEFDGNEWKGVIESEGTNFVVNEGESARKNYWVVSKNSLDEPRLEYPTLDYFLPNTAYVDAKEAKENGVTNDEPFIVFEEDLITGVDTPIVNIQNKGVIYDLQGRRVQKPTQGIYIIDGQKVLIK